MPRTIGGRERWRHQRDREVHRERAGRRYSCRERDGVLLSRKYRKFGATYLAAAFVEDDFHVQNGAKLLGNRKIININFRNDFKGIVKFVRNV